MMQFMACNRSKTKIERKSVHYHIAQASRISGVNPADISILLVYLEQGKIAKVSNE